MALKLLRGNTAQNDAYTGALGEVTVDTQAKKLRLHDGVTLGGAMVLANSADVSNLQGQINALGISDISGLQSALDALTNGKADKTVTLTAGDGLTGGGDLSANRTLALGTPGSVTGATTNSVTADSHTHALVVTKADVGLSNVDNTSDANKPVSTAQQTALNLKLNAALKGAANGVAELDSGGKVPTAQLPDSVLGQLVYQGVWNASTNTPALPAAAAANKGHYYIVSVNGATNLNGITDWKVGDWAVSNGTTWDKVDNTDAVSSVAGKTGAVSLVKGDVGLGNVDNTSDVSKPVSTAQQAALDLKANLASPVFTGAPKAPTPTANDNSTNIATTAYVDSALAGVGSVGPVGVVGPIVNTGTATDPVIGIAAASQAEAEAASNNVNMMTALRTKQLLEAGNFTLDFGVLP